MLRRLARWYGVHVGDLLTYGALVLLLAAVCAGWMLVDYDAPVRAAVAAAGALGLALPPTARRLVRSPALRPIVATTAAALAVGMLLAGTTGRPLFGFTFGPFGVLVQRGRVWVLERTLANDRRKAQRRGAG